MLLNEGSPIYITLLQNSKRYYIGKGDTEVKSIESKLKLKIQLGFSIKKGKKPCIANELQGIVQGCWDNERMVGRPF